MASEENVKDIRDLAR